MNTLSQVFADGYDVCRITARDHWGMLLALFTTGLVGSLTHCAGMCGPFVLSQVGAKLEAVPVERMGEWHRIAGGLALPYHLGRMVTYGVLGALAASALGRVSGGGTVLKWASVTLLGGASFGVILVAFPRLDLGLSVGRGLGARWAGWVTSKARLLFDRPFGWRGFALGLVLGFIPCGLLYAALSTAATLGSAWGGALGMAAFTAGTVPTLAAVGIAGHVAANVWRRPVLVFSPWLLLTNGIVLGALAITMAWSMIEGKVTP